MSQIVCSPACALAYTVEQNKKKAKQQRKDTSQRKEAIKTMGQLAKEAQIAFNAFIRQRDKGKPCISCGRSTGCKMNAGHFRAVGSCPELRFNTWNVWLQCEKCNSYLSGNYGEYRKRLIDKIGLLKVEWLEGKHELNCYRKDDLRRIKKIFNQRRKIYDHISRANR